MSCCCIASSSRMTHPKFITSAATRSFRLLFNICSMGLHGKSTSSRSLLTAGGGTTRNVADRSVQHRKLFVIGWKQLLFAVANTKEVDKYYDLPNILEKAGYLGAYKLLEGESIELRQYGLRDNVAQLSVFEMYRHMREAQSRRLVLGNIHVLYFPGRGDVKLGQVRSVAHILSEKWDHVPIVLAGDYNSTPQSPIYKFLSSSELNLMLHNRKELSGQRRCHPSQVLGLRRERGSLFVLMDRMSSLSRFMPKSNDRPSKLSIIANYQPALPSQLVMKPRFEKYELLLKILLKRSRELGGSVDLLDHYKLGKHLDFFCNRSLPPSISGTQYLRNVVGDTEIKKGEGMEPNQLSKNSSYVRHQCVHLHPFGLDLLTDAFQLREATSADHLLEGIVLPSGAPNLKNEYKEKKQHKKIKHRDGLRKQDPSSCIDKDHMLNRDNDKETNGSTELWSRFFPETASKANT
ncbi:hypothetical protein P3S68_005893 [Capsicum galapagoense]